MKSKLTRGLIFGGLGYLIGLSTGVAASGSAVSSAIVFGPIGFVIGWLLPARWTDADAPPTGPFPTPVEAAMVPAPDPVEEPRAPRSDFQRVEDSLNEMIHIVGRILGSVWNMEMRLLIALRPHALPSAARLAAVRHSTRAARSGVPSWDHLHGHRGCCDELWRRGGQQFHHRPQAPCGLTVADATRLGVFWTLRGNGRILSLGRGDGQTSSSHLGKAAKAIVALPSRGSPSGGPSSTGD